MEKSLATEINEITSNFEVQKQIPKAQKSTSITLPTPGIDCDFRK